MNNTKQVTTYNDAKLWQIGFFSLNNAATNAAMFLMMQYAYFTQNVLGLAAVTIGAIATFTRIFDGITDPIIGFLVDKTNGKFGKFRPFMLMGNIIIIICMIAIFNTPLTLSISGKYIYTTVFYILYIIGYTFQTVCTKAAQAALTNNPKQRPIFSGFDGVMTQVLSAMIPVLITVKLAGKYSVGEFAPNLGLINPAMWKEAVLIICAISFIFTILAMIGIWEKDKPEFFGTSKKNSDVKFKDYVDIFVNNRPIQMLIISAATDKLGVLLMGGLGTYMFANLLLNSTLNGTFTSVLMIPLIILSLCGVGIARKVGIKKCFLVGTWGSMLLLIAMYIVKPNPEAPWIFLGLYIAQKCVASMGSASIIPMIADCTDYETTRSGKFVPGMMGTMFSFVDKLLSSASTLITGFALTIAGVGSVTIMPNQPVNDKFNAVVLFCFCVIPILGHVASIIAMKYYDLSQEKMAEIQAELAAKKNKEAA